MNLLCITFDTQIQLAPIIGAAIAAIIVVIGWFVISYLNRKNEIKKELRGYRLEMLQYIVELQIDFQKTSVLDKNLYNTTFAKIKTFGTKEEIRYFDKINDIITTLEKDKQKYLETNAKFNDKLKVLEVKSEEVNGNFLKKNFDLKPILKTEKTIQEVEDEIKEKEQKTEEVEQKIEKIERKIEEAERKIEEAERKIKENEQEIDKNFLETEEAINTYLMKLLHSCQGVIRKELKFEN